MRPGAPTSWVSWRRKDASIGEDEQVRKSRIIYIYGIYGRVVLIYIYIYMAGISNMPSNFCSYLDTFLAGEKDASFERHLMLDMCPCVRQVKRTSSARPLCLFWILNVYIIPGDELSFKAQRLTSKYPEMHSLKKSWKRTMFHHFPLEDWWFSTSMIIEHDSFTIKPYRPTHLR